MSLVKVRQTPTACTELLRTIFVLASLIQANKDAEVNKRFDTFSFLLFHKFKNHVSAYQDIQTSPCEGIVKNLVVEKPGVKQSFISLA
jgi:hypothetical protein